MKIHNFKSISVFVLILGLCSCNQDKEEVISKKDNWSIASARFVHSDKSSHSVQDTTSIGPQSRIHIEFAGSYKGEVRIQADSICYSDHSPYPEQFRIENVPVDEMIAVKLLPIAMFKPHRTNERIQCDIALTAKNNLGSSSQYDLKGLRIENFSSFFNYKPFPMDTSEKVPTFFIHEIMENSFTTPQESYQTHLLCQFDYNSASSKPEMTFSDLIEPIYEKMQDFQLCRIVSATQDQKEKFISPIFALQKKVASAQIFLETHLPSDLSIDLGQKPVLTFTLENPNPYPIFINFKENNGHIRVQPVSHRTHYSTAWYQTVFSAPLRWQFENLMVLAREEGLTRLKIPGKTSTQILAFANLAIRCPESLLPTPLPPPHEEKCRDQYVLWGHSFDFVNMPSFSQSQISSPDSENWSLIYRVNDAFAEKRFKDFHLWQPTTFPKKCSKWIKAHEFPNMTNAHPGYAQFECKKI